MSSARTSSAGSPARRSPLSQTQTRNIIIGVGLAAVLLGLAASWAIGRSITRPLDGLAAR